MGGVGQLACQGFLVRETCVGVLVCGTGFLLSSFKDSGLLFWAPDDLCYRSDVVLYSCSAFRCSFDEFVGEKVVSPSYSSTILAPHLQCQFCTNF